MKIYVGTSGFGHKEWKGKFYPEKISPKEMLSYYGQRLGAVEINNTFYHMPTAHVLSAWAAQVPPDFVFAFKAPQIITHLKRLRNVFEEAEYLFQALSVLERKLGPVLFQFPKSFRLDRQALADFLALVPAHIPCACEFRHFSWCDESVLDLLRTNGCSLCIADTDEDRATEIVSTATWGYLRLRRSDYGEEDLAKWLKKIRAQKWRRAFVFFKHEEEGKGVEMAIHFSELAASGGKDARSVETD